MFSFKEETEEWPLKKKKPQGSTNRCGICDQKVETSKFQSHWVRCFHRKEKNNADKLNRLEDVKIPNSFDYSKIKSMSFEAREKLNKIQPTSISQASRISGVSPNDISVLLVYMGR